MLCFAFTAKATGCKPKLVLAEVKAGGFEASVSEERSHRLDS